MNKPDLTEKQMKADIIRAKTVSKHNVDLDNKELTEQQKVCVACNECCQWVEIPYTMFDLDAMEFWLMRKIPFHIRDNGVVMFRIHAPCPHSTKNGCEIYDNRPTRCTTYMCETRDSSYVKLRNEACAKSAQFVQEQVLSHKRRIQND